MKVERGFVLACSACGAEGPHELLYLSGRLAASRCATCGIRMVFSSHPLAGYAEDVAARAARLPRRFAEEAGAEPLAVVQGWPAKALRKPFALLGEAGEVISLAGTGLRHPTTERPAKGGRS